MSDRTAFSHVLLALAREKRGATVTACSADGRARVVLRVSRGRVEALEGPSSSPDALVESELVPRKRLDKVLKARKGESGFLPKLLEADGALDRATWLEAARKGALRDVAAVAARRPVAVEVSDLRAEDLPPAGYSLGIDLASLAVELLKREPSEVASALLPGAADCFVRGAVAARESLRDADARLLAGVAAGPAACDDLACAAGVDRDDARFSLLRLEAAGYLRRATLQEILDLAREKLAEGRLDLFLRFAERARAAGADSAALHREMGEVRLLLGQQDAALADFRRAAERAFDEGRADIAAAALEKVIAALPEGAERRAARAERLTLLASSGAPAATLRSEARSLLEEAVSSGDLGAAEEGAARALDCGIEDEESFRAFAALGAERSVRVSSLFRSVLRRVATDEARVAAARLGSRDAEATVDDLRAFSRAATAGDLAVALRERLLERTGGSLDVAEDLLRIAPDHLGALAVVSAARREAGENPLDLLRRRLASSAAAGDAAARLAALRELHALGALAEDEREALARETPDAAESAAIFIEIARGREERGDAVGAEAAAALAIARRPLDAAAADAAARASRDEGKRLASLTRAALLRALEGKCDLSALADASPLAAARVALLFPDLALTPEARRRLGEAAGEAEDFAAARSLLGACSAESGGLEPEADAALARLPEPGAVRRLAAVEAELRDRIEREASDRAAAIRALREELLAAMNSPADAASDGEDEGASIVLTESGSIAAQLEAATRVGTRRGVESREASAAPEPAIAPAPRPAPAPSPSRLPAAPARVDSIAAQLAAAARFSAPAERGEDRVEPAETSAAPALDLLPDWAASEAAPADRPAPVPAAVAAEAPLPLAAPSGRAEGIADIVRRLKDVRLV